MASFRKEILGQIERIDTGRIFTFRDLSFETEKTANVAVLLSEQSRKGILVRVEKGAYFRPKKSVLGLGKLPVYQDEQFRYLTEKLNGYITGEAFIRVVHAVGFHALYIQVLETETTNWVRSGYCYGCGDLFGQPHFIIDVSPRDIAVQFFGKITKLFILIDGQLPQS